jgi:hypothetical protein
MLFNDAVSHVEGYLKGKAVPLQAWSDPEVSRKLRFPDFMTTAQDGGKVVSLTHQPSNCRVRCLFSISFNNIVFRQIYKVGIYTFFLWIVRYFVPRFLVSLLKIVCTTMSKARG